VRDAQRVAASGRRCISWEVVAISVIGIGLLGLCWWLFFSDVDETAKEKSRMRGMRDMF
jgi:hypothetical protein